ncbi:harmonin-binding protein USHBP1 [Bombina bombina]|uniref:harmonin-binding protein USHBP1 n=1 Tax=Bombina bombina TaxID=8345 RepID=UPI00235AFBC1|nr:harmonin-binding protein USHBP1 [Bombina bombina]
MEETSFSDEQSENTSLTIYGIEGGQYDMFHELQDVITSLETCVWSWRSPSISMTGDSTVTAMHDKAPSHAILPTHIIERLSQELTQILPAHGPCSLQSEISRYREQNAALRDKLLIKDGELNKSKLTLGEFKSERDRLQAQLDDLEGNLRAKGICTDNDFSPSSPVCSDSCDLSTDLSQTNRSPVSLQGSLCTLQSLIQYLQSLPVIRHSMSGSAEVNTSSMDHETERLRGHYDHMKQLNELLSITLEECKTDSEKLSMKLGKLESTCTALRLALQSSERCLKTYSVLLALAEAKQEILLGQVTGGDFLKSGWSLLPKDLEIKTKLFMREVKKTFWKEEQKSGTEEAEARPKVQSRMYAPWLSEEEEQTLKDYIRSLKWDLASITLLGHTSTGQDSTSPTKEVAQLAGVIKTKVDDVIKASAEVSTSVEEKPERDHILHDLTNARETLCELRSSLQLVQTENRALELQILSYSEQERAYMLIKDQLQVELSSWEGRWRVENSSSAEKHLHHKKEHSGRGEGDRYDLTPEQQHLLDSLTRNNEMRIRVESLTSELDKLSCRVRAQRIQCAQIIKDFFKAHRKLFITYQNAKKKYQEQQRRLESQGSLMSQRQQQQLHNLMQTILRLQGQCAVRDTGGETSL